MSCLAVDISSSLALLKHLSQSTARHSAHVLGTLSEGCGSSVSSSTRGLHLKMCGLSNWCSSIVNRKRAHAVQTFTPDFAKCYCRLELLRRECCEMRRCSVTVEQIFHRRSCHSCNKVIDNDECTYVTACRTACNTLKHANRKLIEHLSRKEDYHVKARLRQKRNDH